MPPADNPHEKSAASRPPYTFPVTAMHANYVPGHSGTVGLCLPLTRFSGVYTGDSPIATVTWSNSFQEDPVRMLG